MPKFMPKAQFAGQQMDCPVCDENDIKCTVHAVSTTWQGQTKLSWKNPDNSSHIVKQGDEFVHTSGVKSDTNENDPGFDLVVEDYRVWLDRIGDTKAFAAHYHAAREFFEKTCSNVPLDKRGMVVGNMLSNYFAAHKNPFQKFSKKLESDESPAETRGSLSAKGSIHYNVNKTTRADSSLASTRFSTSHTLAVKGPTVNSHSLRTEQDLTNSVFPSFSSCRLCYLSSLENNDMYLNWCIKKHAIPKKHDNNCPNKFQRTLYYLQKRISKFEKEEPGL